MNTWLTLYHHTSEEAARAILTSGRMESSAPVDMPYAFFSTRRHGIAAGAGGYGTAAVEVRVPAELAHEDAVYLSGERFMKVRLDQLRPEFFIRTHLPEPDPPAPTTEEKAKFVLAAIDQAVTAAAVDVTQLRPTLRRLSRLPSQGSDVVAAVAAGLRCAPDAASIQHAVRELAGRQRGAGAAAAAREVTGGQRVSRRRSATPGDVPTVASPRR
ncbi:hypothetical protein [Flexivirga caeni]|uniref:Uncharacterized protein n=1 Tax=Flexivirga caeni TaxID=2294115 RepID=A0A3M9MH04_9MICO|nr:hypothetical protein [Flexivirga caeni]RNI24811.1 hypothetical protein EFY87_03730 [Flexivirga caeni]